MMNNYLRIILIACIVFTASYSNAQFSINKDRRDNQSLEVDTESGVATFIVNFTSTRKSSRWYVNDDGSIGIKFEKTRNEKGWESKVYTTPDGTEVIYNDDFKVRGWNRNENPVHAHSIDSLKACLDKWQEVHPGEDGNTINKPSACLFDVDGDTKNQAFGTHPGKYKRVEYGFHFKFSGYMVTSDIEFEMDTYNAGNTGQTASYELVVATGSESNIIASIPGIYVTGSGKKTIKIAESAGVDFNTFSGEKVYFWLKTLGTGTPIADGSFDPTIVFDNMTVSYQLPLWIAPAAGAAGNSILSNEENPIVSKADEPVLDSLHIQIENRQGTLKIIDDLGYNDRKYSKTLNLTFMDSLGLKAIDGEGNYTIDVPYSYQAPEWNVDQGKWSKYAEIEVAAGAAPTDDMMLYFYATPTTTTVQPARMELDCGVRIWYDVYMQGIAPDLDTLGVSAGIFTPAFDPQKTEYQLILPAGTSSVEFVAKSADEDGGVEYPSVSLTDGTDTRVAVGSVSKNGGAIKAYNVTIHVQNENEIAYLSASGDGVLETARDFDKNPVQLLKDAGYSVSFLKKDAIKYGDFDYSPYAAMVMAPGNSSSNIVQFAKDEYPLPVVCMQPDAARSDKWGWVGTKKPNGKEMFVSKDYDKYNAQMIVDESTNYITSEWEAGRVLKWTTGTKDSADWSGREVKAYNLNDSIPEAQQLGFIPTVWQNRMGSWWAVPAGTKVRSAVQEGGTERVKLKNRVVLMNFFSDGLLYPGEMLSTMMTKSLEWVMNAESGVLLASLKPSMGELSRTFQSDKMAYQLNLPVGSSGAVSFTAIPKTPASKVEIPGELSLSDGMTENVAITVTSEDETSTATYNVMVHVQTDQEILYVSANSDGAYGSAKAFDTNVYDALVEAGYSVTFAKKSAIYEKTPEGVIPFNYTPYIGMVISAGTGSSNVNDYAKRNYPIPCVTMQPDGPRVDKWGWVGTKKSDGKQMYVTKSYDEISAQMVIKNTDHYITQNFAMDEIVTWTSGTATSEDFLGKEVKSYNLKDSINKAIPLATIPADGSSLTTMWAIPRGTLVRSLNGDYNVYERVFTANRVVLMSLFNDGLLYATDAFDAILVRSLEWVLGAGPTTEVVDELSFGNEVRVYPNPAKEYAKVRFAISETSEVNLSLYNMVGQKFEISKAQRFDNGTHEINVHTSSLKEGVYFYVLEINKELHKGKISVIK